jgi:hypothetical protein
MKAILDEFPGDTITLKRAAFGQHFWPTDDAIEAYKLSCRLGKVKDEGGAEVEFNLRDVKGSACNEGGANPTNEIYLSYLVDGNEDRVKPSPSAEFKEICWCIPGNVAQKKVRPEVEYSTVHTIPKRYFDQVAVKLDSRVLIPEWPPKKAKPAKEKEPEKKKDEK